MIHLFVLTLLYEPPEDPQSNGFKSSLVFLLQYENPWTIPNFLCVSRIVLAPFLGHLVIQQHFHLSLALFTLAGATDLVNRRPTGSRCVFLKNALPT